MGGTRFDQGLTIVATACTGKLVGVGKLEQASSKEAGTRTNAILSKDRDWHVRKKRLIEA